ncbi:MAG: hypothetical protein WCW25_00705 [Patescibacteria group bacterium]|jgi:hypothetical protein
MFAFKPRKNDYRWKILLIFGIFCLSSAFIFVFIDLPAINKIKIIKDKIEFQRFDLEKKYFKAQQSKKISLSLNKIEAEMAKMTNVFIDKNRELEFITRLEWFAAKNSLSQEINLEDKKGQKDGEAGVANLYVHLTGKYDDIISYLADLESSDYYINITGLELSSGHYGGLYDLSLKALTYWSLF